MKPYYNRGGVTIYHGDCRDALPQLGRVDTVLTDPPYGVGLPARRPHKMRKHEGASYTFGCDSEEYVESVCVPVVRECIELSTRRVVVTPGSRCMFLYPRPVTTWALYWPNGAGRGRWSAFTCWQPVLCYGEGPKRKGAIPDVFPTTEQADRNGHPCPKPMAIWRKLLGSVTDSGDQVLDPFMGSGTTLVCAKQIGLDAVGIEIEERYCEIAAKQLDATSPLPFDDDKRRACRTTGSLF